MEIGHVGKLNLHISFLLCFLSNTNNCHWRTEWHVLWITLKGNCSYCVHWNCLCHCRCNSDYFNGQKCSLFHKGKCCSSHQPGSPQRNKMSSYMLVFYIPSIALVEYIEQEWFLGIYCITRQHPQNLQWAKGCGNYTSGHIRGMFLTDQCFKHDNDFVFCQV